jgi:hypothetical protein
MPDSSTTPVELYYDGNDVRAGVIPLDYMVDALVGFSGAYAKVARKYVSSDISHRLRVTGLEKGSSRIIVEAFEWITQNPGAAGVLLTGTGMLVGGGYKVVTWIADVMRAKKHLGGSSADTHITIKGDNNIIIQNQTGQPLELQKESYELLESGEIDPDIDKLTAPLNKGRVDQFKLRSGESALVEVDASERPYFVHTSVAVTTTKDNIWLEGYLNSHSKTSNRGTFFTMDGKHIPYRYMPKNVQPLLRGYAYSGAVKVLCNVKFDAEMTPVFMAIYDVQLVQQVLFEPKVQE